MASLREQWDEYSTEHLLERRRQGAYLSDETHQVIEDLLRERKVAVPPRPSPDDDEPAPAVKRLSTGAAFGLAVLYWVLSQPVWIVLGKAWPQEVILAGKCVELIALNVWVFRGRRRVAPERTSTGKKKS